MFNIVGLALLKQMLREYCKGGKPLPFPENALSVLVYTIKNSQDFEVF